MNQGRKANSTGREAEDIIAAILTQKRYPFQRQVDVGESIYPGSSNVVDFVVQGILDYEDGLIIECKWQGSPGSIDEKYPYLVRNVHERYPHPTIVVLEGGGYRRGAEQWLRGQVGGKLIAVMNLGEFVAWIIGLSAFDMPIYECARLA